MTERKPAHPGHVAGAVLYGEAFATMDRVVLRRVIRSFSTLDEAWVRASLHLTRREGPHNGFIMLQPIEKNVNI
jgi:hypothetical protein